MRTNFRTHSLVFLAAIAMASPVLSAQGMSQNSNATRPVGTTGIAPKISPRDIIRVVVLGEAHDKYSGEFTVDLDGCIEYLRLGRIQVKDMTTDQVAKELTKRLQEQLVDPQVMVDLNQLKNKTIFISGEVRSVAPVQYANVITVRQALIMAGGLTDQAANEAIIVRQGAPENLTIDVTRLLAGDPAVTDLQLQDGDTVLVQKAKPVFVQGFVGTPGPVIVRPGTTVQQLIAMAGGVTEKGKNSGIKIQRPNVDPRKKPQEIDVKDWKTEVVKPGDVVIVPKRVW